MFENSYYFENDYFIIKNKPIEKNGKLYLRNPNDLIFKYKIGSGMIDAIIMLFKKHINHEILIIVVNKQWIIPPQVATDKYVQPKVCFNADIEIHSHMNSIAEFSEGDDKADAFKNGLISIVIGELGKTNPKITASIIIENKRLYFNIKKMLFETEFNKNFYDLLNEQVYKYVDHKILTNDKIISIFIIIIIFLFIITMFVELLNKVNRYIAKQMGQKSLEIVNEWTFEKDACFINEAISKVMDV